MNEFKEAVFRVLRERLRDVVCEAVAVSVAPTEVAIRIGGAAQVILAHKITEIAPGDRVIALLIPQSNRYVVIGAYASREGLPFTTTSTSTTQLSPPSALQGVSKNGIIIWQWYAPLRQSVGVEIQYNTSPVEYGATINATRGSQYVVVSDVPVYARIRTVGETLERSAWTDWVLSSSITNEDALRPTYDFGWLNLE